MSEKISRKVSIDRNFYNLLRPALKLYFRRQFNFKADIPEAVNELKAPYLLLPNHQGFWDPFMAALYLKEPVFYIASDAVFRYPLFEFFMKLLGAIPKKKAQSDTESIKHIMKIRDAGGVIGVFPEGRRTWDGTTLPLYYSTSKLIKLLKVPVVTALFKGVYYSQPRWGRYIQKGKVTVEYRILLKKEDIKTLSVDEIHRKLTEALFFDEIEYHKKSEQVFSGKNPAENIEQAVFMCPTCREIGTLYSEKDEISCSSCGYSVKINKHKVFFSERNKVIFDNVRDWIRWEKKELEDFIDRIPRDDANTQILKDSGLLVQRVLPGGKRMKNYLTNAVIVLTKQAFTVKNSSGKDILSIPVKELLAVNVQNKEKLDFYFNGVLFNIFDRKKKFSAYKWLIALQHMQNIKWD